MSNADRLRRMMARHGLTRGQVAELARSSESAVDAWLRPPDNAGHRGMPDGLLELVALKLGESLPASWPAP